MARNILPLLTFFLCFAVLTLPFGLPQQMALVDRQTTQHAAGMVGDKQSTDLIRTLNHRQPQLVLIGNSMLGEGVHEHKLEALLKLPTAAVWSGGVGSAWWYLVLKNIILQLKTKPTLIGIIFRDNHLTLPTVRVTGKHKKLLDSLASKDEELLDRLAYLSQENILSFHLKKYIPLFEKQAYYRQVFDATLQSITSSVLRLPDSEALNRAAASVFASNKMIPALLSKRQLDDERQQDSAKKDMTFQPEQTFLKPMIELCQKQGIPLVFIRVKRRRDLKPDSQPQVLLDYMDKLSAYLQDNKVYLLDYTNNTALQKEHFGGGDHLNRQSGRQVFTAMLAADIQKILARIEK